MYNVNVSKRIAILLTILFVLTAFVFAGGKAEKAAGPIELTVWATRDNFKIDPAEWNKQNPDIKITYEVVPWERQLEQLLLIAGTNRAPDISSLDNP